MIIPDVNLLLYTYDAASPFHQKAARWWQECLSDVYPIGLPLVVVFAFVRIATHPRVFRDPFTPSEAAGHVRSWLAQPAARVLHSSENHLDQVLDSLEVLGTAGNLVSDAQLAVLAIEHDATLHTNDTDFARFEGAGLRWHNPLKA